MQKGTDLEVDILSLNGSQKWGDQDSSGCSSPGAAKRASAAAALAAHYAQDAEAPCAAGAGVLARGRRRSKLGPCGLDLHKLLLRGFPVSASPAFAWISMLQTQGFSATLILNPAHSGGSFTTSWAFILETRHVGWTAAKGCPGHPSKAMPETKHQLAAYPWGSLGKLGEAWGSLGKLGEAPSPCPPPPLIRASTLPRKKNTYITAHQARTHKRPSHSLAHPPPRGRCPRAQGAKLPEALLCVAVGVVLFAAVPRPQELSSKAWALTSIFVSTILGGRVRRTGATPLQVAGQRPAGSWDWPAGARNAGVCGRRMLQRHDGTWGLNFVHRRPSPAPPILLLVQAWCWSRCQWRRSR